MLRTVVTPYEAYVCRSFSALSRVWNLRSCTRSTVLPRCPWRSIRPGITKAPFKSLLVALSGARRSEAAPTHETRPASTTIAASGTGGRSVPSISVKFRRTSVSPDARGAAVPASPEPAGEDGRLQAIPNAASAATSRIAERRSSGRLGACIFENPSGAGGVEHAARAESSKRRRRLLGRAAVLLDEVDHLLRQRVADHAVSAHRRQHHHLPGRHLVGLALEAERIADAVPRDACMLAAVFGAGNGGRHVDAEPEVLVLDPLDELLRGLAIVEHGGARRDVGQAVDDRLKVGRVVACPVRQRVHAARRTDGAAVTRVTEVDRAVFDGDLQEAPQPIQRVGLLERPLARHRKDDEVVVEALGGAEAVQGIGHVFTISGSGFSTDPGVEAPRRPRPTLVLARASW